MKPFLKSIAEGYVARYGAQSEIDNIDLSEICFVFPNKRAGAFFLKYISELSPDLFLSPEITNITDFVTYLSRRQIGTRLELLLQLYTSYLEVVAPDVDYDTLPENLSFENFRIWGDTVLRDFSDVDLHNVDPQEIFSNIENFRTIATDYLSDEQKEVIEEYFGKKMYELTESFWRVFPELSDSKVEGEKESARGKFLYLWQILWPLYQKFDKSLASQGLATTGKAYRIAMTRLQEMDSSSLPWKKIVLIGFNALSGAERGIFTALRDMATSDREGIEPIADFIWDTTGPILTDSSNPAGKYVAANRKRYSEPEWLLRYLSGSETKSLPAYMEEIASPSNALQTKIAGEELIKMYDNLGQETFKEAKVAVVLPDESLLIPMLYGLPESLGSPNLTMGYPLKETSVATFMALLRGVQTTQRYSKGGRGFGVQELYRFLAHPLSHAIFGTSAINRFRTKIAHYHRLVITKSDIAELGDVGLRLLRPISSDASMETVSDYLYQVLDLVAEAMTRHSGPIVRSKLEYVHARSWQKALKHLTDILRRYAIPMKPVTLFYEAERLLSAETVPFKGEPLQGLQIMGLLETRLLDFDHVIILSMNDRIMPRRARQRTFIPDMLRRGYGLPPSNYQESIFSYYFYRLISRAKSVRMLYDSRVGLSGGGPSRYLHQLELLYANHNLIKSERKVTVSRAVETYESSSKGEKAVQILDQYRAENKSTKKFSASSLKKYCICPLKFYLEFMCGIKTDVEESDILGSIAYGDIFHALMETIYLPEEYHNQTSLYEIPYKVTKEQITNLLNDREGLYKLIVERINRDFYHKPEDEADEILPPSTAIIAEGMLLQLESVLKHDMELAPFEILGCESSGDIVYPVSEDLSVKITFRIDRIDRIKAGVDEHGNEHCEVRIVDYKTGSTKSEATQMKDYFVNMASTDPGFQMMLYAEMLMRWDEWKEKYGSTNPSLVVYEVKQSHVNMVKEIHVPRTAEGVAAHYGEVRDDFNANFKSMLEEIYRPDTIFKAVPDEIKCDFCALQAVCHR